MYHYRLYGFHVISDLFFPQLVKENIEKPDSETIYILAGEVPEWLRKEKVKKYSFGMEYSWLSNRTAWIIVENGNHIWYVLKENGKETYLQSYILGFGLSMLAMQRGMLSLHCSALCNEKGAVLIAGESGVGKSTVASAILEEGYSLMADDMVLVETGREGMIFANPAFPFQKLCRNVAEERGYTLSELLYINEEKDKFLVPYQGDFCVDPMPVRAFVLLGMVEEEKVEAFPVLGTERISVYANNLFLRHLLKEERYSPSVVQKCLEMAAKVSTYYVGRPIGKDTTEQVIREVLQFIESR